VVRIRLKKTGRTHRSYFRVEAFDGRSPRDGRSIESLGSYDPRAESIDDKLKLNRERIVYWLEKGAQPTEKVAALLKKHGIYAK